MPDMSTFFIIIMAAVLTLFTASPTRTSGLVPTCQQLHGRPRRLSSSLGFAPHRSNKVTPRHTGKGRSRNIIFWKKDDSRRKKNAMVVSILMSGRDGDNGKNNDNKVVDDDEEPTNPRKIVIWSGLLAQPIIWSSLLSVKTTGAGLPSGPFGIVGAVEGISYLLLLGWAGAGAWRRLRNNDEDDDDNLSLSSSSSSSSINSTSQSLASLVENLSALSLVLGLLVLVSLVVDQGCVPNAKPILDYSAYLPVCEAKAGLFGG
jgi:hypothetical protein